jgi:hypothetical protein
MTNIKKNMTAEEVYERITFPLYEGGGVDPEKLAQFLAEMLAKPVEEWKPEDGDEYWFTSSQGYVCKCTRWENDEVDKQRRDFLGVYPTKQAAEEALQEIKSKLGK